MNRGRMRYVFTSSNTSQGFQTFIPNLMEGLQRVFILKGAAGTGKTTFIRLLGESLYEQGYEVEFWISALDPVNPEGFYLPQLEAAVVNGSMPRPVDPRYPGGNGEIVYLGEYLHREALATQEQEIRDLVLRVEKEQNKAYNILRTSVQVKNEIKKASSGYINNEKYQQLVENLAAELLAEPRREKHYFASAVTADGLIDYVDELSSACSRRYIFTGPAGSGKSTIIEELAQQARERGHFLEYYHCGVDGDSICMLIIRNLQLALIDAEYAGMVKKPWDIIVDMKSCLDDDYDPDSTDIKTSEARRQYESLLLQAQNLLDNALGSLKELKKINSSVMDYEPVDRKLEQIKAQLGGAAYERLKL